MANPPCCEDRSRTHDACNASMHHVPPTSGLAAFPLRPLPPEPPYTVIASFKQSNTFTDAYMPHLDAGLAPTSLDHPHLRHNPRAFSSLIDVHCHPSHCLPRWMPLMLVLPQCGVFLYRELWPLEYDDDDATAYKEDHQRDQRPSQHAYSRQQELECTTHVE